MLVGATTADRRDRRHPPTACWESMGQLLKQQVRAGNAGRCDNGLPCPRALRSAMPMPVSASPRRSERRRNQETGAADLQPPCPDRYRVFRSCLRSGKRLLQAPRSRQFRRRRGYQAQRGLRDRRARHHWGRPRQPLRERHRRAGSDSSLLFSITSPAENSMPGLPPMSSRGSAGDAATTAAH